MITNPFIITEKVIPEYFCDRKDDMHELIQLLQNGNNVVLISNRRVGKTGLIQYCFQHSKLTDDYTCIYLDILSTTNLQEFTFLLGREVFDTIRSKAGSLWQSFISIVKSLSGKIGFDPYSGLPTLNIQLGDIVHPEYTLKEIFQYLSVSPKPCIVAIDEFQQIAEYPEKNVEALIRSHLLQINNCRMIFSGSERHILGEMFTNNARPFYQSASFIELNVIPQEIYVNFIVDMFENFGKSINKNIAKEIYEKFDGVTFYVQRVCNGVFANTESGGEVTDKIFHQTLDEILSSYDVIYRTTLSELTTRQKELLLAVSQNKSVVNITSVEFLQRYSLTSSSAVQTAMKALQKKHLITRNGDSYRLDDQFLRLWLNLHY